MHHIVLGAVVMLVKLWRGQYNPLDNDMNPWDIYDEQDEFVLNEET